MREVKCDNCKRDISTSTNSEDWRLALINQAIPSRSEVVTDMMMSPPLYRDYHFCGLHCLKEWLQ